MDEPSLLEAFRTLGPLTGDRETYAGRNAAAARLLAELRRCAARMSGEAADHEEAVGIVLWKLTRRGPRGVNPDDPGTDSEVVGFLHRALRNEVVSLLRRRGVVVDPQGFEIADDRRSADDPIDVMRARSEIEAARQQLEREIVPSAAGKLRGPAAEYFLRSIAQLRDVAAGRASVNDIVESEDPDSARVGGAAWRRARNRVDKRFSRVFRGLGETIEALRSRGEITPERYLALEIVVAELRVREGEGGA